MTTTRGDIFVVQSRHPFDRLIRVAQHRKFPSLDSSWTHCGIIVDACGGTIEAVWNGVEYGNVHNYPSAKVFSVFDVGPFNFDTDFVRTHGYLDVQAEIVRWAERRVGLRYGFATIASIAIAVAIDLPYRFEHQGTYICSGLVASALASAGIDLGDNPEWTMPAQIAAWGKVV
jgi:uncharacterized protein YycO